jgi:hypothetical protein
MTLSVTCTASIVCDGYGFICPTAPLSFTASRPDTAESLAVRAAIKAGWLITGHPRQHFCPACRPKAGD